MTPNSTPYSTSDAAASLAPVHGSARLRTRFGFPVVAIGGASTACWQHDRVTALERSGGKVRCKIEYQIYEPWGPRSFEVWLDKSVLRFSAPNAALSESAAREERRQQEARERADDSLQQLARRPDSEKTL